MSTTTHAAPRHAAMIAGWTPYLLSILRIVAALLLLEHGRRSCSASRHPQPGPGRRPSP